MNTHQKQQLDYEFIAKNSLNLSFGKIGIEKECLRVLNQQISQKPHPAIWGSSLCNSFLTNDFSEAQPELITLPFNDNKETLDFLEKLHHYVSHTLGEEILWPLSMPPSLNEIDIPIASFGNSNQGKFKQIYRNGLSHRYGKLMQVISGVHFNYSLPEEILEVLLNEYKDSERNDVRSEYYLKMLRNVLRMNWIIIYFFGASPLIPKDFIKEKSEDFSEADNKTAYLPYATSLRMSEFGYQNLSRASLKVSSNSLHEYTEGLMNATRKINDAYKEINIKYGDHAQLNQCFLQIEDEYYAAVRAKSNDPSNQRFITKLTKGGINFLEIRSLDLNPFSRIGINNETTLFLEVFLISSFLQSSEAIDDCERDEIFTNDLVVAKKGRKKDLLLIKKGKKVKLKDWANQILDEMQPIAELMSSRSDSDYIGMLNSFRSKVMDPSETISARLLDNVLVSNKTLEEIGESIAYKNKNYYQEIEKNNNNYWELFTKEAENSLIKQKAFEDSNQSFEEFKSLYFKG